VRQFYRLKLIPAIPLVIIIHRLSNVKKYADWGDARMGGGRTLECTAISGHRNWLHLLPVVENLGISDRLLCEGALLMKTSKLSFLLD